ncbi:interference hedgehog-like isoform X2 [Penaeus monodon]|uniref:interference hedgehog-like isoform X2 n=1 Tax=Penaeus monodon TaxID=6687 RepID=UPI0018A7B8A3|nr:interference hedgehog-like isoform X2 [Penaeus monodon]
MRLPSGPAALLTMAATVALVEAVAEFGIGFTQWPEREVIAVPGTQVRMPCATNVTAEKISWQYNHHFLLEPPSSPSEEPGDGGGGGSDGGSGGSEPPPFTVLQTKGGSQLVITLGREGHFRHQLGLYQCVAWFGAIALTSLPGRLEAALLEDFPVGVSPPRVEVGVREGGAARVECGSPQSVPDAQLTFFRDGREVDADAAPEAYRVTPHGDLLILNVGAWAEGEYTCSAHNAVLNRTVTAPTVTVVTLLPGDGEDAPHAPPEFVSLRTLYTGRTGTTLRMTCLATGNPQPKIWWTKYGGTLPARSSQEEDGSLRIESLEVQDEGTYLCHAGNGVDSEIMLDVPLEVLEPPEIVGAPEPQNVEEGKEVDLKCRATGHPEPKIMWVFNGGLVRNDGNLLITDQGLTIRAVEKKHAGIFQCFAHNPEGTVQAVAMISVVPKTVKAGPHSSISNTDYTPGEPSKDRYNGSRRRVTGNGNGSSGEKGNRGRDRNGKRRGQGRNESDGLARGNGKNGETTVEPATTNDGVWRKKGKKGLMVPPSRPNMTKVSDESVMVTWDVHNTTGLPILFYKVQYKEVGNRGNRGSRWMTVDEDILPHINSYEVTGLHTGRVYKFRIAAVYANNDNKLGKNSKRFLLKEDLTMQRPVYPPKIVRLLPLSPTMVRLEWEYEPSPGVPVEGFFINYREATTAGEYTKVTVLNPRRTYEISHLKPNVSYDFKIQCFNIAGTSDFSPIYKKSVAGSKTSTMRPAVTVNDVVPVMKNDDMSLSNIHLYIILGAVLALLLLIVIVSSSIYACRNRNSQDDSRASKYEDTSLHIHRETTTYSLPQSNRNNGQGPNGYLSHQGSPLRQQNRDEKVPVESSLVENNNHNIQMLRNWQSTPGGQIRSYSTSGEGDAGAIEMRNSSLPRSTSEGPVVASGVDTTLR